MTVVRCERWRKGKGPAADDDQRNTVYRAGRERQRAGTVLISWARSFQTAQGQAVDGGGILAVTIGGARGAFYGAKLVSECGKRTPNGDLLCCGFFSWN